ncbi:MAG TPA: YsnF/AvaK domain-containing protein [Nannocystis sp.]|jgi:uncharacterized protein (TIGR02271 family)
MNTPAILLVTDRDGVRGFIDVGTDGWTPDRVDTLIQLSDGGNVRVPTSLLTQLDDSNYFLSCSIADLLSPETMATSPAPPRGTHTSGSTGPVVSDDVIIAEVSVSSVVATVPVVQETFEVHKQVREAGSVRVNKHVHVRTEHVEVPLRSENIEITRVPINRVVDGPVPVRHEGDTTIYPVLEEVLVLEKRLVLREELHLRVRQSERVETHDIELRSEEVTTERSAPPPPPITPPSTPTIPPPPTIKRGETP